MRLPRVTLGSSLLPRLSLPSLKRKPKKKPTPARRAVDDEDDLFARASRAYARARAQAFSSGESEPLRPSRTYSGITGRGVYSLRSDRALLVRYRIATDGSLRQMVD